MSVPTLPPGSPPVDVMLLLEGTYPYIRGGVSSWVHQIITGLPDLRFGAVFLGGQRSDYEGIRYELPANLVHLESHFLMESWRPSLPSVRRGNAQAYAVSDELHQGFKRGSLAEAEQTLKEVSRLLGNRDGLTRRDFLFSEEAWNQIADYYEKYCTDPSFVDYFWTVRTMHAPLFDLAEIARSMPASRVLHSISTGYAGFLAALTHQQRDIPFLLTEHGIYTKERRIDLAQAEWIHDLDAPLAATLEQDVGYMRQMWIRFFEGLGRMTYRSSAITTALYEGNRQQQLRDGADEARSRVVPNGIDVDRYAAAREQRGEDIPPVLALIGRVVPIKDIKTFIRAMRVICSEMPDAEGWIVGPDDEDEEYAWECRTLVENLGLTDRVKFLGFRNPVEIFPKIGLNVLSSISEAQPLVILEGFSAGVPALTTEVGCCQELIAGTDDEDRALGTAGAVVPISNPVRLAEAALDLLRDPARWRAAQATGVARARRFYDHRLMFDRYRAIYDELHASTIVRRQGAA